MTAKARKKNTDHDDAQSLREEIERLRAELDEARAAIEFRDFRRQALSRMLKIGIWEWDEITGKPTFYSDELAEIYGVESDEFRQVFKSAKDFEKIVHPDDLELYRSHADSSQFLKSGGSHGFDYRIIDGRGRTRHLREIEMGEFDDDGRLISSFGLVQDVSDVHASMAALQESEERYSSLFAQLPIGVQEEDYSAIKKVVDKLAFQGVEDLETHFLDSPRILREMVGQTRITNVNEALINMHEASSREEFLAGEADIDDWWDAQWVEYYAAEIATLASNRYHEAERIDSRIDNSFFETRTLVTVVRGYEDTWERVITIHEDITERKQAEAALIEAKTQAEKANQAKSEFLSSMSHEFRTPLNAILGFSQLFSYDRELDEQHLANANEISRAGRHLMSLIDQILDLERIEAGDTDIELGPVSLGQVLSDSVHWVQPLTDQRKIGIEFAESDFEHLSVLGDSIRLKQVFLNLLTNAVKYNKDGGRVEVILERGEADAIRVGVRDTGRGISEDKLEELFQPFNRLGAEFSTIEGTGIGLVISRQLLDQMHGSLEIDSEPDVGSTFWVELRESDSTAPREETQGRFSSGPAGAGKDSEAPVILVAEDNRINQELIAAQLEVLGYRADFVEDGVQALLQREQGDYGALLTDIRMPKMDGYQLVHEIRRLESESKRRLPIIAITANALEADIEKCFEAGVDDVIPKPVELEDLRLALNKWAPGAEGREIAAAKPVDLSTGEGREAVNLSILVQSTGEKPQLHRKLLRAYRGELKREQDNIQQAFAWKNNEQLGEYTHKLKSSSRSLGVVALGDVCEAMEKAARKADWDRIEALMPKMQAEADGANTFIADFLGEAEASPQAQQIHEIVLDLPDNEEEITQFSIRLMIVDDDYVMHRIITVMLNDLGISSVRNATSGQEALDMIDQAGTSPDVVICDLNMPGMDGVEFIRHLSKRRFEGSLIMTSGEDVRILKTVEKLAIEHDLHVLGVLEKPVIPARLGELLDALDQVQQEGTMLMSDPFNIADLARAIDEGEMDTFFQPKVDIQSGRVVGVEALARWNHPDFGVIRPNAFIPLAEEHDLIGPLTEKVCDKALDYAVRLKEMGHDLNVAINISVDTLTNLEWPDHMSRLLKDYGLDPASISFEITESRLMEHLSVALDILSRLSLKRFHLSIDDFGTGYSSMEQLQRIPFSEFKIDRAFVHGAARDTSARAILESSVLLAKKLDMKVVAEGVEDQEDWNLVAELGCDQVQGYFVSRPMTFERLGSWLKERKSA